MYWGMYSLRLLLVFCCGGGGLRDIVGCLLVRAQARRLREVPDEQAGRRFIRLWQHPSGSLIVLLLPAAESQLARVSTRLYLNNLPESLWVVRCDCEV